jgi:hypothetical protein
MNGKVWPGRPTPRSTDCLSALPLEQIMERVDTLFLQDSPQLSVRSVSLGEIVAVFFSKCPNERVAVLTSDLSALVAVSVI